ncbi:Transposase and inactivated derivatives [Actinomyces viscosus]|uniref:Transposase and inactivated derivatives n=1 Tax=Actinomyces viscosus TaxID=1656 RepID=A0A3S4WJM6_ACTVI|nr:Transposase and inactivated derivatives [Actinomyces viscosus]VEI16668.1 Transposase and inactivated derivatives [Actinomyces viscosus]VEI17355.1 Transposase and inactivated derivatives [Actinomyces viscosus]
MLNHPSDIESPAAMTHRNAPLTPQGRYRLVMRVQSGRPIAHVAAEAGIARATLSKWVARYRQGGTEALEDRSSAPVHRPTQTSAETVDLIEHWRRTHKWSARRISHELAARGTVVSVRTVTRWLDRAGLNRRRDTRPHRAVQPGQQTYRGPFPGPHDPPGRQEGRTHPTRRAAGGPTGAVPLRRRPPSGARQPGSATPTCTPLSTVSPAWPTPRPWMTRGPRPRSASSAGPGPSSPTTA